MFNQQFLMEKERIRIAILGGGPSALFMYKRLVETNRADLEITIFEKTEKLGVGFPYGKYGASDEHITNVSDNEIPNFVNSIEEWTHIAPKEILQKFTIEPAKFNEYKVLPRLFFGEYLSAQFKLLQERGKRNGILTHIKTNITVIDLIDQNESVIVEINDQQFFEFDKAIIATGHNWPHENEGKIDGYFDSPYPPAKIRLKLNHNVAIRGSSLTAIDAIRTLARENGSFSESDDEKCVYQLLKGSEHFKMVMHSRNGLLPAVRFHLEDSRLRNDSLLSVEDFIRHRNENNGFISLDFVFEKDFKEVLKVKDPQFYGQIKDMSMQDFVDAMMELREKISPFKLLEAEYQEAAKSIKRKESVYWKEMLAILSFSLNYPAKYFAAEDMLRFQKTLMPLISIVIAFVPQSSCEELLALHQAGVLDVVSVGDDSEVKIDRKGGIIYTYKDESNEEIAVSYQTFIDCIGQPHLKYNEFPFKSLIASKTISPALLQFANKAVGAKEFKKDKEKVEIDNSGNYYLKVPGIKINDNFQLVDDQGNGNTSIFIMAVPYIGGFNPDYSGIDFCEEASKKILEKLF